jgi:hypothetical protein
MCFEHFRHGRSLEEEEEDPLTDENENILPIPAICKFKNGYDLQVQKRKIRVFDVNVTLKLSIWCEWHSTIYMCECGK